MCEEIDAFLAIVKWLRGYMPEWTPGSRRNQMVSYWPVMEEGRDESRAYLVFSIYGSAQDQPSVSPIYRNWEVCRVDVKPKNDRDFNPEYALRFGLPKAVFGTHIHLWEHNREYVLNELSPDRWRIPNKMPISQSARKVRHILPCICNHCGIYLNSGQRDVYPPRRKEFAGGKS